MAYNTELAERIAQILRFENVDFYEKKMFGGVAFMINDKMCMGIVKDQLMLRVLDTRYSELLESNGAREMDFTGRSLKGFLYIDSAAIASDRDLKHWADFGVEFGRMGVLKTSKKRK